MNARIKFVIRMVIGMALAVLLGVLLVHGHNVAVLNPAGQIAAKQRNLIILSTLLGLVVILPVYALTFVIAWRYREGNRRARYSPDWDHNAKLELTWWAIPFVLIFVLSVIAWRSSHELDPYRPLQSAAKPVTIQVVALQWKWLFIYPEQHIATVNYVQIPAKTPVNFEITSDAPMNSFWIPELGGQIYAMPGMSTQLHLEADRPGAYYGSSANLSGEGFAGMRFVAQAMNPAEFDAWVKAAQKSPSALTSAAYRDLAKPGLVTSTQPAYGSVDNGLYTNIVNKFMLPDNKEPATAHSEDH